MFGGAAILLWACLAPLATATGTIPPFQITAMSFAVGFMLALGKWLYRRESIGQHLHLPPRVWALGILGIFGFHVLYFTAMRLAPPVEANLINYLWPLLIVVFTPLLIPGERLRWFHIGGAFAGLLGTGLLIGAKGMAIEARFLPGYVAALGSALAWSLYSVLSRRLAAGISTDSVGGFCGVTAILALLCHLLLETTVWPRGAIEWSAVLLLGLGPTGGAFFLWDIGVKRGDIKFLGIAAYAAPLLSTILLLVIGQGTASWQLGAACALIIGGAVIGSGLGINRRAPNPATPTQTH